MRRGNVTDQVGIKRPILLPGDHGATELIVARLHRRLFHAEVAATIAKLQERFWVTNAKQCMKRVIGRCIRCVRLRVEPSMAPMVAQPADRVNVLKPFHIVGVDFTGPVYLQGEPTQKSYIVLFTCTVVHASHLELVLCSMADSFFKAFQCFVARRGFPTVIYSNNALCFKHASHELCAVYDTVQGSEVGNYLSAHCVTGKFSADRAPW